MQLSFAFPDKPLPQTGFVATRPLARHRSCNVVMRKLHYARRYFPELNGRTIRVGLTRAASGMAVPGGEELWLNPASLSYHTITHELMHLLQGTGEVPTGERSCDVFALARHWTLNDTPPYYVRVPGVFIDKRGLIDAGAARVLYAVACDALTLRSRGERRYIAYFEAALARLAARRRAVSDVLGAGV